MVRLFLTYAHHIPDQWTLVCDQQSPQLKVYKYNTRDNCFKVIAQLSSTPESAFDILSDIQRRKEWDDLCEEGHVIQQIDGSTKIQYMKTKAMWPTASRDVVSLGYCGQMEDGGYLNVTQSILHKDYPPNVQSTIVRMDAKIAGQLIKPSQNGNKDQCSIIQVADGDLK